MQTQASRRFVLKSLGVLPVVGTLQNRTRVTASEKFRIPKDVGLDSEVLLLEELPGVTVEEQGDIYIIIVNRSQLRSPSFFNRVNRGARISSVLQTISEGQERYPPQTIGLEQEPISIGEDFTLSIFPKGGKDIQESGWVASVSGSSYNHRLNSITSSIIAGGGSGTLIRNCWIGAEFKLAGSASKMAEMRINGSLKGLLTAYGSGSASANATFVARNVSNGEQKSKLIYSDHVANLNWRNTDTSLNNAMTVRLQGGYTYRAEVHLQTRVDVNGLVEAGSDFGPEDVDDAEPPQGLDVDTVQIRY